MAVRRGSTLSLMVCLFRSMVVILLVWSLKSPAPKPCGRRGGERRHRLGGGDVWNFRLVILQPLIKTGTLTFYRILDKMKELPEPQKIMICKLLLVNPACAVRHSRKKVLFSAWIKNMALSPRFFSEGRGTSVHRLLRSRMAKRLSNLTILNSYKERTDKFALPT